MGATIATLSTMTARTRALEALETADIDYELLEYVAHNDHFGDHAVAELGLDPALTLKTLVIHHGRDFAVCCVPVAGQLALKKAAKALGWKNAEMADPKDAQRLTGYVVGGISPLGTARELPTVVDSSVEGAAKVTCSAGQRGLSIAIAPQDLARAVGARFAAIAG